MYTAQDVINFIEDNYDKKFPTEILIPIPKINVPQPPIKRTRILTALPLATEAEGEHDNHVILAGGSVANAILSMATGKKYPIKDFDVYVIAREAPFFGSVRRDQDRTPLLEIDLGNEYGVIRGNNLYMTAREQQGDVDIIKMRPEKGIINISPKNTALNLINSFDLNCTKAAIVYDQTVGQFELVLSDDFIRFIKTRQIEVTNVHTLNTIGRAMKKARELDSYVDMDTELLVIFNSCNIANLKIPTQEQVSKFADFMDEYLGYVAKLQDLAAMSTPDLYDIYANTSIQGTRYLKAKIARMHLSSTFSEATKKRLNLLLENSNSTLTLLTIGTVYKDGLEAWFGTKTYSKKRLTELENYLTDHPRLQTMFLHRTLSEMFSRYDFFNQYMKKYGYDFISGLEYTAWEDTEESDNRCNKPLPTGKQQDKYIVFRALHRVRQIRKETKHEKVSFFAESGKTFPEFRNKDIIIKELDSTYLLRQEGSYMRHCVGGYGYLVQRGDSRIFHCTIPSTKEEATLEVGIKWYEDISLRSPYAKLSVKQLQGRCIKVSDTMRETVGKYVKGLETFPALKDYLLPTNTSITLTDIPFNEVLHNALVEAFENVPV